MKKKLTILFAAISMALTANFAVAATPKATSTQQESATAEKIDSKNPYNLIEKLSINIFSHIKDNQSDYKSNPDLLKKLARKDVLPYINVRYAALKILGPFANKASKQERDEFTDAFTEYLVSSYAQILVQYTDQKVKVEQEKPVDPSRTVISVRVDITDSKRPPINLDFKLRKNRKTQEWQGFDVQVEGVSMLDTKASEWQGDLRKHGVLYVAKQLRDLAKAPIKTDKESDS